MTERASSGVSGGSTALAGFFYQIDVSVWAALDLVLVKRLTHSVVLEAADEEDLEAELDTDDPGPVATAGDLASYRLIVQAKTRDTGPWSLNDLKALLTHGKRRRSAAQRLEDPKCRYLLVTNADLAGAARNLIVPVLGAWPLSTLPATLSRTLPGGSGGRVGVLSTLDGEKLASRTRDLLESFRVPHSKMRACKDVLRQEAQLRMRGASGGVWTREGLESTIRAHDGILAASAEAESFVPPTNWPQFKKQLLERHAVIIDGPSGTGKTTAAHMLATEMTAVVPGLARVTVIQSPLQVWAQPERGPVLFMIEDPWGRYRFEPTSRPWNDDLPKLLNSARADRLFIITSRRDVLHESGSSHLARSWFVSLEPENYGLTERARLFEHRLPALPRESQRAALSQQVEVMRELRSPLEIQKYFDALAQGPESGEAEPAFMRRCLASAHRDAIGVTLVQQVAGREAYRWAALAWGLLKARPRLSREILPLVEARLVEYDREFEDGLERFFNFLVASRNLRQIESAVSYSHPTVEGGLQAAIAERPALAARTLSVLVDALIAFDTGADDWGCESAANLVKEIAKGQSGVTVRVSTPSQARLDSWLRVRLGQTGTEFRRDLDLAATIGSSDSIPSELARWLRDGEFRVRHFERDPAPPAPSTEWFARIAADRDSAAIAAAFVREVLPFTSDIYQENFAVQVARVASDITPAFLDAASAIVDHGYMTNADTIADGAQADLDGFARVAAEAVDVQRRLRETPDDAEWLAVLDGEYSEDYAEHVAENRHEEGHTANVFLAAYAERLRRERGWQALRDHSLKRDMVRYWVNEARSPETTAPDEELGAIFEAGFDGRNEAEIWKLAGETWRPLMSRYLVERLLKGHRDNSIRLAATACLEKLATGEGRQVVQTLLADNNARRILELFVDLDELTDDETPGSIERVMSELASLLPRTLEAAVAGLCATSEEAGSRPGERERELLTNLDPGDNTVLRLRRARRLGGAGLDVGQDLDVLLAAGEIPIATEAAELSITLALWDRVEAALDHRFADVRRVALVAVASRSEGALPARLLALAKDRGSRVRRALLTLLSDRRDSSHLDALIALVGDTWSDRPRYYEEDANYPIAQAAASLLAEGPMIEDRALDALLGIASSTEDSAVRDRLLYAIARNGTQDGLTRVVDLALALGKVVVHRSAAKALWRAADRIDEETAARFTAEQLRRRTPRVAVLMALIVGERATEHHAILCAQAVTDLPERRVLLIPLMVGASGKRAGLTVEIGRYLPEDHLGRIMAALNDGPRLDRSALEDLGSVRAVDAVFDVLPDLFEASEPAESDIVDIA